MQRKLKETWSKELSEFCQGDGTITPEQKELIKLLEKELLEYEEKELQHDNIEYLKEVNPIDTPSTIKPIEEAEPECIKEIKLDPFSNSYNEKYEAIYVAIIEAKKLLAQHFEKNKIYINCFRVYLGKDMAEVVHYNNLYSKWSYWTFDEEKHKQVNEAKKPVFLTNLRIQGHHVEIMQDNNLKPDQFVVEADAIFKGVKAKILVTG